MNEVKYNSTESQVLKHLRHIDDSTRQISNSKKSFFDSEVLDEVRKIRSALRFISISISFLLGMIAGFGMQIIKNLSAFTP